MQFVSLFLLSSMSITSCYWDDYFWPRVFEGVDDVDHEFPYAISLQMNYHPYSRLCTGSLVSNTWVITAGQCIHDAISTVIRHGEFTKNATKARAYVRVIRTFKHPGFDGRFKRNDIALMLIDKIKSAKVFVKLLAVDYRGLLGLPVKFAGFGKTGYHILPHLQNKDDEVRPLQKGEGVVIACPHLGAMCGPAICVAPTCTNKLQSVRQSDFGGPLVFDGKIIGVLSAADVDSRPISGFTPLSPYLEWIFDVMNRTYEIN